MGTHHQTPGSSGRGADNEPDPVIHEIPIILSKFPAGGGTGTGSKNYLLQYPLQPKEFPAPVESRESSENPHRILGVRFKPNQQKLQMTVGLDTNPGNYDLKKWNSRKRPKGTGAEMDVSPEAENQNDEDLQIVAQDPESQTQILESASLPQRQPHKKRFAFGYMHQNGTFILSPVHGVLQLKPRFVPEAEADETIALSEAEAGAPASKVTVRFTQSRDYMGAGATTTPSSFNSRKFDSWKTRQDEEPWIDLEYRDQDKSLMHVQPLEPADPGSCPGENVEIADASGFMETLIPKTRELSIESELEEIQTLGDRLRILFLKCQLLRYSRIVSLLKSKKIEVDDEPGLLKAIQTVAVLVQGTWIVRSELLYPKHIWIQRARDLILFHFNKSRFQSRTKLRAIAHISMDNLTEILALIAVPVRDKQSWEWKLPFDEEFVSEWPDVVTRQGLMWDIKNSSRIRRESEAQAQKHAQTQSSSSSSRSRAVSSSSSKPRSRNVSFSSTTSGSGAEPALAKRERGAASASPAPQRRRRKSSKN